jgi:hypothetical protein
MDVQDMMPVCILELFEHAGFNRSQHLLEGPLLSTG